MLHISLFLKAGSASGSAFFLIAAYLPEMSLWQLTGQLEDKIKSS
jgi:hypothetical protein